MKSSRDYVAEQFAHLGPRSVILRGYAVRAGQLKRCKPKGLRVEYTIQEFLEWYVKNFPKGKGPWHVGRLNHKKGYSFGNIKFQTAKENTQERNHRRGNPGKTHRPVKATCLKTGKTRKFKTEGEAMEFYGVSRKTVYNHCSGRTKQFFKFGPKGPAVRFEWA